MPALTRGFLFCDLRGYSAYTDAHGDHAARELLRAYRSLVREVIGSFDGSEIRTEGDSFYVVFGSVSSAVDAGLTILDSLGIASRERPDQPIRAGIGVHAGEAEDTSEGIVSGAVNIAARICAAAEPGQLLVSDTVRSLTRGYLDVGFAPLGERRLKGIAEPIRLYRVTRTTDDTPAPRRVRGRWLTAAMVGVGAGIVLAAAAIIGGTLMNVSIARTSPSPSTGAEPSSASGSSHPSIPAAAGFPTLAEQQLLERLPDSIGEACVSADPDEIPIYQDGIGDTASLPHTAALRCPVAGGIDAFFYSTNGVSQPEVALFGYAGRRGAEQGSCDEEGALAIARWTFGPAEGWVLCGTDMFWTYDGSNILGRASGGLNASATMAWWREHGRFPAE